VSETTHTQQSAPPGGGHWLDTDGHWHPVSGGTAPSGHWLAADGNWYPTAAQTPEQPARTNTRVTWKWVIALAVAVPVVLIGAITLLGSQKSFEEEVTDCAAAVTDDPRFDAVLEVANATDICTGSVRAGRDGIDACVKEMRGIVVPDRLRAFCEEGRQMYDTLHK
jgi:hypothetical protein